MVQVIDKVEFRVHGNAMRVRVVHEGDVYVVKKMDYAAQGREIHCNVVLERVHNNAAITRLK